MDERKTKPETEAHKQWVKKNTVFIGIRLQNGTDRELIDFLSAQPSKQGAIKTALREYIANHK
jgi:hypothetical protein